MKSSKAELAEREPTVAGKIEEPLPKSDSLKKSEPKVAEGERKIEIPLPSDRDMDRMMSFLERAWRRLIEMANRVQRDVNGRDLTVGRCSAASSLRTQDHDAAAVLDARHDRSSDAKRLVGGMGPVRSQGRRVKIIRDIAQIPLSHRALRRHRHHHRVLAADRADVRRGLYRPHRRGREIRARTRGRAKAR